MKKILLNTLIILSLSMVAIAQSKDAFQQSLPPASLLKPTLKVRTVRDLNYWKQPNLKNYWSWMPKVEFLASGPIDDASYFTYEFFTPDGKLWFSHDSEAFSIREGESRQFESQAVKSWTDKRSTILTGEFSFKITLKNSLQGTSKPFYQGKFKVGKEFAGTPHPDFKNQNIFYVDHDWALPMAYLNFNAKSDPNAPYLVVSMWFRGASSDKINAYLFYNGKQIANTEGTSIGQSLYVITEGDDNSKYRWEQNIFYLTGVRYFDNEGGYKGRHIIKQNPGNYELKVLYDSELVRTVAFTVGADGKIVDSGIAKNNNLGGFGILVPAKVIPTKEGAVNLTAYKTDSFYGNPLTGF